MGWPARAIRAGGVAACAHVSAHARAGTAAMSAFMLEIVRTSGEHVVLVATAVTAAFAIGAPAAIALTLHARTRRWVLGAVNVIQTIPSLALFGVPLPIPLIGGIGKRTAIIVLALYALLPIMRNMVRSEEHTSELQSPVHLVCRL